MTYDMCAGGAEFVQHSNNVGGSLCLIVARDLSRLVAQSMPERVNTHRLKPVGERVDNSTPLPACCIKKQPVQQNHQGAGALNNVMKALAMPADVRHRCYATPAAYPSRCGSAPPSSTPSQQVMPCGAAKG